MSTRLLLLGLATSALAASCGGDALPPLRERGDFVHRTDATLRMNEVQMLATHNSYHVRHTLTAIPDWQYSMPQLRDQLGRDGIRGLEIDVHWNPETLAYDVRHIALVDDASSCPTLDACLREIRAFSDENPGHHPLFVQFELKTPMAANVTDAMLDALDAEIRAVFPDELRVTPEMVRGTHATLAEAVTTEGWPALGAVRGRTLFAFDCDRTICLRYAGTDGSLTGRVIFPDSVPTDPFAAVMIYNSPDAGATSLVQQGFLVRVFADSIADVLAGTNELDAALASGAQVLSTDVPAPRIDVTYRPRIPGGTPSRCNPVIAPASCVPTDVEDPALLQGR